MIIVTNTGTITVTFLYGFADGIVGDARNEAVELPNVIFNCINIGTIKNAITPQTFYFNAFGGIVGRGTSSTIYNCVNYGYVKSSYTGESGGVGGIIGVFNISALGTAASITNSINVGVIESNERKGCLIGYLTNRFNLPVAINNNWWDKQMCPHNEIGDNHK